MKWLNNTEREQEGQDKGYGDSMNPVYLANPYYNYRSNFLMATQNPDVREPDSGDVTVKMFRVKSPDDRTNGSVDTLELSHKNRRLCEVPCTVNVNIQVKKVCWIGLGGFEDSITDGVRWCRLVQTEDGKQETCKLISVRTVG